MTRVRIVFSHILLFALLLFFSKCVTLYKPNAIYSPLLKEKGDLNTSASIGLLGNGLYNAQAAYAISNHTGIMIDGMYHNKQLSGAENSVERLNIFFGEAGCGYFTPFGKNKKGLFQCYGGGGYGTSNDKISNSQQPNPEINAKYYNVFIQPGLAIIHKNVEFAFDLRANYINMYNIHAYLYNKFDWWNTNFHYYSDTSLYFINLEPAFTLKAGGEKLKGVFQLGLTIPTVNSQSYFAVNNSSLLGAPLFKISVGAQYTFGKKIIN